jgi:hypothetical protein
MTVPMNRNMQHILYNIKVLCLTVHSLCTSVFFNSVEYNSSLVQNMICESFEAQSHISYSLGSYSMLTARYI